MSGTTGDRSERGAGHRSDEAGSRARGGDAGGRWRGWSRRQTLLGGLSLAGVIGALFAGIAIATDSLAGAHRAFHTRAGFGPGRHHGPPSAEDVDFFVDWTLSRVDASEDQKARAREIARSGAEALGDLHRRHRENRERWTALLTADPVDRGALEALRADELALADEASRRLVGDVAALAELLTPEQRASLAERAAAWHARHAH